MFALTGREGSTSACCRCLKAGAAIKAAWYTTMSHSLAQVPGAVPPLTDDLLGISFADLVRGEMEYARARHRKLASSHEALGVILEEVGEFTDEVFKHRSRRNPETMLAELVQIAAMCQRAAEDLGFIGDTAANVQFSIEMRKAGTL